MKIPESIIRRFSDSDRFREDFDLINFKYHRESFEFEHSKFAVITRDEGRFFAQILISKRLILAYAQNLLQKKNILLLPDFVETSSVVLLTDILNRIEEEFNLGLEISHSADIADRPTTDFIAQIRYKKIFAPVIIRVNSEIFYRLIVNSGQNPEEFSDFEVTLLGEKYIPLETIGELGEKDILKMPPEFNLFVNKSIRIGSQWLYQKEETVNNSTIQPEQLSVPVTFSTELGNLSISQIREILNQNKVSEILNNKECKIIIGNTVVATGDIYENQVRIAKIFI